MTIAMIFLCLIYLVTPVRGQKKNSSAQRQGKDYSVYFNNPKIFIDEDTNRLNYSIDLIHPHLYEAIPLRKKDSLRALIKKRKSEFPRDSVTITEYYYIWKPYLDLLNYEDPHHRVMVHPQITDKSFKENDLLTIPVNLLIVGDTAIVDKSCDRLFHQGDRLMTINGTPINEYLKYYYPDRYVVCLALQQFYHFSFTSGYCVEIERQGRKMQLKIDGLGYSDSLFELEKGEWKEKMFDEYQAGYIALDRFYPNNSLLIKTLSSCIKRVQKAEYTNMIIDLRKNGGGNGHDFDKLISLFTKQDSLHYVTGQKIRVSDVTLKDYNFLKKDMVGKLVDMPEPYAHKVIPLHPKRYLGKMSYYVLISRNTGSIAASFANILQRNNLALLVGEPLMHNALKYGETTPYWWTSKYNVQAYSTVQMDEYTKSADGQVYPDISIPFVAAEYMNGGDPVLEKLLEYIKNKNE